MEVLRAALLSLLDEDWHRVLRYGLSVTDDSPLSEVVDAMESHLRKQRSVLVDRRAFYARVQEEGENFEEFLCGAKELAAFCDFCTHCYDSRLRDKIVCGLRDEETVKRLLEDPELDLKKAVDICRARYDESTRRLSPLKIGSRVDLQDPTTGRWNRIGVIVGVGQRRTYLVKTASGRVLWRNRRYLRPYRPLLTEPTLPVAPSAPRAPQRPPPPPPPPPERTAVAAERARRSDPLLVRRLCAARRRCGHPRWRPPPPLSRVVLNGSAALLVGSEFNGLSVRAKRREWRTGRKLTLAILVYFSRIFSA
ncbi:hypothetical protein FJT64_018275 [Amphibalanus amphitrite]|uniref:Uncharacterized protein n=1 Tax=Amphibalanus amphitrite TaxID=1232801 RepID=A0A6A4WY73_AMPAM|nr:hypothetical protein FJT64_018275 [Amphibalanus amphitrite]